MHLRKEKYVQKFFDMASCYILRSSSLNVFYIGATRNNTDERTVRHNSAYYGSSFTSKTNDWIIYLEIECSNYNQALKIERHIKKMKSTIYIQNLIEYPEIIKRLLEKYK